MLKQAQRDSLSPFTATAGVIESAGHYGHILAPSSLQEDDAATLLVALRLAAACDAELTVLHVVPPPETPSAMHWLDAIDGLHRRRASVVMDAVESGRQAAREFAEQMPAALREQVTIHLECRLGEPATEIARFAERSDVDMVVLQAARSRWSLPLRADLPRRVMRLTKKPVMLMHPPAISR